MAPWLTNGVRKAFGTLLPTVPGDEPRVLAALGSPDRAADAPVVLLAGFDPEEESPIVFLRLRKAARKGRTKVYAVTPIATGGIRKTWGTPLLTVPGQEAAALGSPEVSEALAAPGSVVLVGERLAESPGALAAAVRLAETTGAKLGWVPRRAGDRGALEAGAFPTLLPGGRPVSDEAARAEVAAAWGAESLPTEPGLDTAGMLAAAAGGHMDAMLVAGVDPYDMPDPQAALAALGRARFLVSIELRRSAVTDLAHVVLPIAAAVEKDGSFADWEGRVRPFDATLRQVGLALPDYKVVSFLARELGADLGFTDAAGARAELSALSTWSGTRATTVDAPPAEAPALDAGQAVLATWPWLLDSGRMQDGEPHLAGTARSPRAFVSATTAKEIGAEPGQDVTVSTERGSVTLPLAVAEMPDRVVFLPSNSPGSHVRRDLAPGSGAVVSLAVAEGAQS